MVGFLMSMYEFTGAVLLALAVFILRVLWVTGHLLLFGIGCWVVYKFARLVWNLSNMSQAEVDEWLKV